MIELGVDEITLVLQLPPKTRSAIDPSDWPDYAHEMINVFSERSHFKNILGDIRREHSAPLGYTDAFTFGEHNFFLAVAYHDIRIDMGVVVKFSAQSFDYYLENAGLKAFEFMQIIQDDMYTTRVSRVDLTADYIDENIDVTSIYQNLMNNSIAVFRETIKQTGEVSYRRTDLEYQGFIKGHEVPTVYLGSSKSNSMLRIYDKKREQIERNGSKLAKAKECKNWARFEGVFRHEYAHQIGDAFLDIKSNDEFANLIATILIQKFRIMEIDKGVIIADTIYTSLLDNCIISKSFILKSPSSRNYELAKSLNYLFEGSGVITSLFKIEYIWGEEALSDFLKYIYKYLQNYMPNEDCKYWLLNNAADYQLFYPDFKTFMKENVGKII